MVSTSKGEEYSSRRSFCPSVFWQILGDTLSRQPGPTKQVSWYQSAQNLFRMAPQLHQILSANQRKFLNSLFPIWIPQTEATFSILLWNLSTSLASPEIPTAFWNKEHAFRREIWLCPLVAQITFLYCSCITNSCRSTIITSGKWRKVKGLTSCQCLLFVLIRSKINKPVEFCGGS